MVELGHAAVAAHHAIKHVHHRIDTETMPLRHAGNDLLASL